MTWSATNGVTFGEYNSFRNWGLYLRSLPVLTPPEPKTNYIDVPGMNGELDLTESLTGDVPYKMRNISFEFSTFDRREEWFSLFSAIQNYMHGKEKKIILDEDPSYYYIGRISVESFTSEKYRGFIKVSAIVDPYKYEVSSTLDDWLWDTFSFENGIIQDYNDIPVNGSKTVIVQGRGKTSVPTITVDSSAGITIKVTHDGKSRTKKFLTGKYTDYEMRVYEGDNTFLLTGNGTVSIDYRGSSL